MREFKYDRVIFGVDNCAYLHLSNVISEPVGNLETNLIHPRNSCGQDSIYEPDSVSLYVHTEPGASSYSDGEFMP